MLIIPWDLFSMKKLLKNEICGSVNSVRRKVKKLWLKIAKKKKKTQTQTCIWEALPKHTLRARLD